VVVAVVLLVRWCGAPSAKEDDDVVTIVVNGELRMANDD